MSDIDDLRAMLAEGVEVADSLKVVTYQRLRDWHDRALALLDSTATPTDDEWPEWVDNSEPTSGHRAPVVAEDHSDSDKERTYEVTMVIEGGAVVVAHRTEKQLRDYIHHFPDGPIAPEVRTVLATIEAEREQKS